MYDQRPLTDEPKSRNIEREYLPEYARRAGGELGKALMSLYTNSQGLLSVRVTLPDRVWRTEMVAAWRAHNNEVGPMSPDYWA